MKLKLLLFLLFFTLSFQITAQRTITGKVTDFQSGLPLAYAVASVKDTTISVKVSKPGFYQLKIPQGYQKIKFSHIGYDIKEIQLEDLQEVCNVFLKKKANRIITGKIRDAATLENLMSASISIECIKTWTVSNEEGFFRLEIPINTQTLLVDLIGYHTQEIRLTDDNDIYFIELDENKDFEIGGENCHHDKRPFFKRIFSKKKHQH